MEFCTDCGMPFDDCNESQPVCPCCGEAGFTDSSPLDINFRSLVTSLAANANRGSSEIDVLRMRYQSDPRNIRFCQNLRRVCLCCGTEVSGYSFFKCPVPGCGENWRVSHCGNCKQPVDSRDPVTPRCPKCGWLICAACHSCNCTNR
jgi:hypothetical protein